MPTSQVDEVLGKVFPLPYLNALDALLLVHLDGARWLRLNSVSRLMTLLMTQELFTMPPPYFKVVRNRWSTYFVHSVNGDEGEALFDGSNDTILAND